MMILHGDLHQEAFESVHMDQAMFNVPRMLKTAIPLENNLVPATYDRDSFIFVFHATSKHVYFFPGIESENRDDNSKRVKEGVALFVKQGFDAYSLSS